VHSAHETKTRENQKTGKGAESWKKPEIDAKFAVKAPVSSFSVSFLLFPAFLRFFPSFAA
jgi:hypothetical protein